MSYVIDPNGVMIALAENGLLNNEHVEELSRLGHLDEALSDELILGIARRRGWLTPWQCEQIRNGRMINLRFGEFVLLDFIHRDKFDRIFEARSVEDGRKVALKVLTSQSQNDPAIIKRMHRDLETSRSLTSPWTVRCEGIENYQGRSCLIREWVDGMTLRRFVETHGRFARNQVVEFMAELARGLKCFHDRGFRHGSIRSDRIFVKPDGRPLWFDFGWASEIGVKSSNNESAAYRELEKASHAPAGDPRSDAYFLGCVFYELLAGSPPHPELEQSQDRQTLMVRTFGSEIPLSDISNPPKSDIARTVSRMMSFRPDTRLADPDEIIQCFERISEGLDPESRSAPADPSSAVIDTAELYAWLNGAEPPSQDTDENNVTTPKVPETRPMALANQHDRIVLCVEAQEEIQREFRKTFDKLGWKSRMVRTTDTAADMAREKPADIVVYDADGQGRESLDAFLEIDRICSLGRQAPHGLLLLGPKQLRLEKTLPASIHERYTVLRKPLKMRDVKTSLLACAIQK
jgi:serine/threonine protein kinase